MLGDAYGSLAIVAIISTLIIVVLSIIVKETPILINFVFCGVLALSLWTYSMILGLTIPQTFGVLFQMVVGTENGYTRLNMILFWLLNVAVSVVFCAYVTSVGTSTTIHRKFFHLTVSLIYMSGIFYDPQFTTLCAWLWLSIFVLVELLRFLNVPPWSKVLNEHLLIFKDAQDSELLMTPIYLLIGIFLPLLLSFDVPNTRGFQPKLYHLAGVAAVGVGDSFAAIIGSKFGKNKWKRSPKKSMEGTLAMLLSMITFLLISNHFLPVQQSSTISIIIASLIASICEAFITSMDNLILPFLTFMIL